MAGTVCCGKDRPAKVSIIELISAVGMPLRCVVEVTGAECLLDCFAMVAKLFCFHTCLAKRIYVCTSRCRLESLATSAVE